MIGMEIEESKTLDETLSFNKDNLFEYINFLLFHKNADLLGDKAEHIINDELASYIKQLPINGTDDIYLEASSIATQALVETSHYAFMAGFKEACRLLKTLNSF